MKDKLKCMSRNISNIDLDIRPRIGGIDDRRIKKENN